MLESLLCTPCRQGAVFCTEYVHVSSANADPTLILPHYYDHSCISYTQLWQLAFGVVQVVLLRPLLHTEESVTVVQPYHD